MIIANQNTILGRQATANTARVPFAHLSKSVFQDQKLNKTDLRIIGIMATYRNTATGLAWPSVDTLSRDTGIEHRHVQRSLRRLEGYGYLVPTGQLRGKGTVEYRVVTLASVDQGGGKTRDSGVATSTELGWQLSPPELTKMELTKKQPPTSIVDEPQTGLSEPESDKLLFFQIENSNSNTIELNQAAVMPQEPQKGPSVSESGNQAAQSNPVQKTELKPTQRQESASRRTLPVVSIKNGSVERANGKKPSKKEVVVPDVPVPVGVVEDEWRTVLMMLAMTGLADSVVGEILLELEGRLVLYPGQIRSLAGYTATLIKVAKQGEFFLVAGRDLLNQRDAERLRQQQEAAQKELEQEKATQRELEQARIDAFLSCKNENEINCLRQIWLQQVPAMFKQMFQVEGSLGGRAAFRLYLLDHVLKH